MKYWIILKCIESKTYHLWYNIFIYIVTFVLYTRCSEPIIEWHEHHLYVFYNIPQSHIHIHFEATFRGIYYHIVVVVSAISKTYQRNGENLILNEWFPSLFIELKKHFGSELSVSNMWYANANRTMEYSDEYDSNGVSSSSVAELQWPLLLVFKRICSYRPAFATWEADFPFGCYWFEKGIGSMVRQGPIQFVQSICTIHRTQAYSWSETKTSRVIYQQNVTSVLRISHEYTNWRRRVLVFYILYEYTQLSYCLWEASLLL